MAEAALPVLLGGAVSALGNYFGAQTAANAAKQSAAFSSSASIRLRAMNSPLCKPDRTL